VKSSCGRAHDQQKDQAFAPFCSLHPLLATAGSSTVCVVTLDRESGKTSTANIGDSGFLHIRDGGILAHSEEQQYGFNAPYQLSILPPSMTSNLQTTPDMADVSDLTVRPGDLIILASDGFLDNVFPEELKEIIQSVEPTDVEALAKALVQRAKHLSNLRNRVSPFGARARAYGYRYIGGKPDDITVVVAHVVQDA
jgi:protein phosphatase PTC7